MPAHEQPLAANNPKQKSYLLEIIRSAPLAVKVVVIGTFLVLGTIETMFWIGVARRYFSTEEAVGNAEQSLSAVVDDELRKHKLVGKAYQQYKGSDRKDTV
jgi:hypothetical protein